MKKNAEMQKRTALTFGIVAIALLSLFFSGCYPVLFIPESSRADARPEYVTKYFAVKPPKGRWTAVVRTRSSFKIPYEGDLLAQGMPEMVKFYTVPWIRFGLEDSPTLTIASYPVIKPKRFHSDPTRMTEALETRFERSKKRWWTYKQEWTGKSVEVETKPDFRAVKIGGKTFYETSEVYADTGARVSGSLIYYYFTKKRAFVFYSITIAELDKNSEILKIMESFEPIDFTPSKEEELLEKALYLWCLSSVDGLSWPLGPERKTSLHRTDFIADYSFKEVTQAFQDVIDENPDNYLAHLFLGIHYLTPKEDFYETKIKRLGDDVQSVFAKNMWKFDLYRLNPKLVVNKKDVYSYLLLGNFNDVAAISEFKKALEIKPESYAARHFLSWLYLRTQEYEKAVLEFSKLLEKDPQDADALLLLSTAYEALGSEKESDEYYRAFKKAANGRGWPLSHSVLHVSTEISY